MDKCAHCNKNSLVFSCKCTRSFCTKHLLPEFHNCTHLQIIKDEAFKKNKDLLEKQSTKALKVDTI
jgi:predicted nucleic acid binding AN1-type Zn finger protein